MPVTVASVERSFRKIKIVNKRLRTTMSNERSNSLLTCTLETLVLDELSNSELTEKACQRSPVGAKMWNSHIPKK